MNPTDRQALVATLQRVITLSHNGDVISPAQKILMAEALADYCGFAITKFIAGQVEHGGRLQDRDLHLELFKEHIDSFWYHSAMKWPK
jgi:hypothetical protein